MALPDPSRSAEANLLHAELVRDLRRCLYALDKHKRHAIETAFFHDVTYHQLAEKQGVPIGTMKSWMRRAFIELRGSLEDVYRERPLS